MNGNILTLEYTIMEWKAKVNKMSENWIVPCNIKFFDIIEHFDKTNMVVWKRTSAIKKGDYVYIYIGKPYGVIKYKCEVVIDKVENKMIENNQYAITPNSVKNHQRYVQMKLIGKYPDKCITLSKLRLAGLGQVQIQARTDRKVQAALDEIDMNYMIKIND